MTILPSSLVSKINSGEVFKKTSFVYLYFFLILPSLNKLPIVKELGLSDNSTGIPENWIYMIFIIRCMQLLIGFIIYNRKNTKYFWETFAVLELSVAIVFGFLLSIIGFFSVFVLGVDGPLVISLSTIVGTPVLNCIFLYYLNKVKIEE